MSLNPSVCVVTPTIGRLTLERTLLSAAPDSDDEWQVIGDGAQPQAEALVKCLNSSGRKDLIYHEGASCGNYGNSLRDMAMSLSDKDYFLYLDDDDIFVFGIWSTIKRELKQHYPRPVIFRMMDPLGRILWKEQRITPGNVGGSMFCPPNIPEQMATWGDYIGHGSDVQFIEATLKKQDMTPAWSGEVIIKCKPE